MTQPKDDHIPISSSLRAACSSAFNLNAMSANQTISQEANMATQVPRNATTHKLRQKSQFCRFKLQSPLLASYCTLNQNNNASQTLNDDLISFFQLAARSACQLNQIKNLRIRIGGKPEPPSNQVDQRRSCARSPHKWRSGRSRYNGMARARTSNWNSSPTLFSENFPRKRASQVVTNLPHETSRHLQQEHSAASTPCGPTAEAECVECITVTNHQGFLVELPGIEVQSIVNLWSDGLWGMVMCAHFGWYGFCMLEGGEPLFLRG